MRNAVFTIWAQRFRHHTCTYPAAGCTGLLLYYSHCYISVPESYEVIWLLQTFRTSPWSDEWKQLHYISYGCHLYDFIVFENCHGTGKFITQQLWLGSLPHRNPTVNFSGSSVGAVVKLPCDQWLRSEVWTVISCEQFACVTVCVCVCVCVCGAFHVEERQR